MHRLLWAAIIYSTSLFAVETGPTLYSGNTGEVSGYFRLDKNKVVDVKPGDGIKCSFSIQRILHHHAGEGFQGWHVEYSFEHPELEDKVDDLSYDFFWNEKELGLPFRKDFTSSHEYMSPIYDPPYRTEMSEDAGKVILKVTGFGGLTWRHFVLTPSANLDKITQFEMVSIAMGQKAQHIICSEGAK